MASFDAIQNFNDTLDELRELCNYWKVSEEDVIALTEDLQQLVVSILSKTLPK